jgi:hypothetical protein
MTYYRGLVPLLAFSLAACTSSRSLATGDYEETRGPGVMMWTYLSLRILPDQTFEYVYNTDDEGGKYGAGTYQLRGRKLKLAFNGRPLVQASSAQLTPLPTHTDSLLFTFDVYQADSGNVLVPAAGVTVLVRDNGGRVITGAGTAADGRATLHTPKASVPRLLTVNCIGYQPLREPLPPTSTAYKVYLQPSLGQLYAAGSVLRCKVLRQSSQQLVLRWGNQKVTMVKVP